MAHEYNLSNDTDEKKLQVSGGVGQPNAISVDHHDRLGKKGDTLQSPTNQFNRGHHPINMNNMGKPIILSREVNERIKFFAEGTNTVGKVDYETDLSFLMAA